MKTTNIPMKQIVCGRSQNAIRHDAPAIQQIAKSIEEIGLLSPILVKERCDVYAIADGHRRFASYVSLEKTEIRAIIYKGELTEAELWAAANGATRAVSGADWFYSWARECEDSEGDPRAFLARMKGTTAAHIRACVRLFTKLRAIEIGLQGRRSPVVASFANLIHAHMASRLGTEMKISERDIGEWLLVHGMEIRKLISTNPSKRVVRKIHGRMRRAEAFPKADWI